MSTNDETAPAATTTPTTSIEGLDENGQVEWGDYPIDRILARQEPATIADIMRRIDKGFYKLDPEFQRDFLWPVDKQSRLIESVLMRIPLPVFYLAEQRDGTRVVVDGRQRFTTLHNYVNNRFALKLENKELSNRKFQDLLPKYQNRIEDTYLTLILLDAGMPERFRLNVFERVNSGEPINRQQMRNCLYTGNATRWLRDQAVNPVFLTATGNSLDVKQMRDREVINRFCAFYLLGVEEYRGDMDEYLKTVLSKMNTMSQSDLDQLHTAFEQSMVNNTRAFGKHAFRKYPEPGLGVIESRNRFNVALFDVFSVLLAQRKGTLTAAQAEAVQSALQRLMADEEFMVAISRSTQDTRRVKTRFAKADAALKEVLDAPSA